MKAASDGARPRRRLTALVALLLIVGCGDDPVAPTPSCDRAPALPLGQTLVHTLDENDPNLDRAPVDYFSIRLDTPGLLVVDMSASGIDPFLLIWEEDRATPLAQAYDPTGSGVVRTATLQIVATPGCYLIAASGWEPDTEGEYTIRADFTSGY